MPQFQPSSSSTPALSVITPVYNLEAYVGPCIESVLAQTFRELELIVVDDGSTDRSAAIIESYIAKDPRVRGFRGPNRGVSHARNVAMQHARGRYFALLDGDDAWAPSFAQTMVRLLDRQREVDVITGNGFNVGGPLNGQPVRPWPAEPRELAFGDMIEHVDSVFIMSMFRREVYEAIGGFNETLFRNEDYEYWLRAAAAGFRFLTHPEPLGYYRRRDDSLGSDKVRMLEGMMKVLSSAREFRKRARADELGAIDRQLEHLRAEYLLTMGKAALLRGDCKEARSRFSELSRRQGGIYWSAVALGLKIAPRLMLGAYRLREQAIDRRNRLQRLGDVDAFGSPANSRQLS